MDFESIPSNWMPPSTWNLPSIADRKEQIKSLLETNLDEVTIEELCKKIEVINQGHISSMVTLMPGMEFFRGIIYEEKPKFWEDLIYPPRGKAIMNRVNEKGQSMFYCGTMKQVGLYEINAKPGDKVVLTTWLLTQQMGFLHIGYSTKQIADLIEAHSFFGPKASNREAPESELSNVTDQFLRENFCKKIEKENENLKKLTIAIARCRMGLKDFVEGEESYKQTLYGLFYPTTKLTTEADNFAFMPEMIDSAKIICDLVEWIEIVEIDANSFSYKILDIALGFDKENRIVWENLKKNYSINNKSEPFYFANPFEETQAFLNDGTVFQPDE